MKITRKFLSLALAAACVLSLAGCQTADTSWIARFGDTTVPAGVHLSHLVTAYSTAASKVEDPKGDVLKQTVDGEDASAWITNQAMQYTKEYIAAEQKFDELGLTISQEDQNTADMMTDYQWAYLEEMYTQNGVAKSSLSLSFVNSVKKNNIFKSFYYEGGSEAVSDQELTQYYSENYIRTQYIAFSKKDSSGAALEGEALDKVKAEAQGYYDRAAAGENFAQLLYDYRVSKAADASTVDPLESDAQYDQIASKTSTGYPEKYLTEMFAAEVGTPLFFEDDSYYFVALRKELMGDGKDFESKTAEMISALRSDEFEKKLAGWAEELKDVTYNEDALKRYTPDKVKYN